MATMIVSCDTDNELAPDLANQIAGIYNGTLTSAVSQEEVPATAEIKSVNYYSIKVHCYCDELDTTFSLNLYQDGILMRVCATGEDFKKEYGHEMSDHHQMMEGSGDWSSWQQHVIDDHTPNDVHYGYFDTTDKTFHYTFKSIPSRGAGGEMYFKGKR